MRLTDLAHDYLNAQLQPGDRALDATAGTGHDTAYMAGLVGSEGHIIAIGEQGRSWIRGSPAGAHPHRGADRLQVN